MNTRKTRIVATTDEEIQALIADHMTDDQQVQSIEDQFLAETRTGLVETEHVPVRF